MSDWPSNAVISGCSVTLCASLQGPEEERRLHCLKDTGTWWSMCVQPCWCVCGESKVRQRKETMKEGKRKTMRFICNSSRCLRMCGITCRCQTHTTIGLGQEWPLAPLWPCGHPWNYNMTWDTGAVFMVRSVSAPLKIEFCHSVETVHSPFISHFVVFGVIKKSYQWYWFQHLIVHMLFLSFHMQTIMKWAVICRYGLAKLWILTSEDNGTNH